MSEKIVFWCGSTYVTKKYPYMYSLNLLIFVHIVVFNVETALENAKLVILEGLQLHFFVPILTIMVNRSGNFL